MIRLVFLIFGFILISKPCLAQCGWKSIAKIPVPRQRAVAFNIGNFGYVGTGDWGPAKNDFWRYNPEMDTWEEIASIPTVGRTGAFAFAIDGKGYVGGGFNQSTIVHWDFWEYDPEKNEWTRKADLPTPTDIAGATSFSIGHRGYYLSTLHIHTFFEYNPYTDTWATKAEFPGVGIMNQVGFTIDNKGYIGSGYAGSAHGGTSSEFWEYDPITDLWTKKANIPGLPRTQGVGFGTGSRGYIGMGVAMGGIDLKDFWEYDPDSDSWTQIDSIGYYSWDAVGFSIGEKGYVGSGFSITGREFWEYTPTTTSANTIENKHDLKIYPNPVKDQIHLEIDDISFSSYSIYSANGQKIKSGSLATMTISVEELPVGVYVLSLLSEFNHYYKTFIKTQ